MKQFIEDPENENTRKKTQQNVALLKELLTLRNELRLLEEIRKSKRKQNLFEWGEAVKISIELNLSDHVLSSHDLTN